MPSYDAATVAAIHEALDDEYKARATYAAVLERFGPVRPFVNIIAAEERHARALERLLARDGRPVPADPYAAGVTPPATLEEALATGVQAEIENRALYDRLKRMTDRPEVLRVFANLGRASQENHLPAFQRALSRTQVPDGGPRTAAISRGRQGGEMPPVPTGAGRLSGRRAAASHHACGRGGFGRGGAGGGHGRGMGGAGRCH